jgi:phage FluMu gp28-like protein
MSDRSWLAPTSGRLLRQALQEIQLGARVRVISDANHASNSFEQSPHGFKEGKLVVLPH